MGIFRWFLKLYKEYNIQKDFNKETTSNVDVNIKIKEFYQLFEKEISETDDSNGESLTYWYDIIKGRAKSDLLGRKDDEKILELIHGHADEYRNRLDSPEGDIYNHGTVHDDESKVHFIKMRIFSFGRIYTSLLSLEKKINDELINDGNKKHKIESQLNSEIAHAKSSVYGAVKYAIIIINIKKTKIKKWFPEFIDDEQLIQGINPFDSIAKKHNITLPSTTEQYELSEEEKDNIPEWYTGSINEEGSVIRDEETGKEIKLNPIETSIYNLTKMNNLLIGNMQKDIESGKADKIILEAPIYHNMLNQLNQGKTWLKENNLEAYKVLFTDLEDNNIESSNSNNESTHYQIASGYEESGEYKLAMEHYTKSIEKNPNHSDSYVNRGRIYDEVTGQLQLAIDDYTKAINIDPDDVLIYYNRGIVFTKLKRYDDGIKDFTKAIEIDPNYASAYKNRGFAKQKAGMDACSDWKKACSLGIEECCIWYEEDNCGDINNQNKSNKSELRVAFNETDVIEGVTHYKGNPLAGIVYSLHDNGELKEEIRMIAGYRNGLHETWNENGQLIVCINFKSGIPCGISKSYYDTGELKAETNFIDFVPGDDDSSHIITINYLKNGELKDKAELKYGEVIKS